jgi:hypothetical protein
VGKNFPHTARPALGPTQPPVKWVPNLFPRRKAAGAWRWPPTPPRAEVKDGVELYFYSPSEPPWPVRGWNLPLPSGDEIRWRTWLPILRSFYEPVWLTPRQCPFFLAHRINEGAISCPWFHQRLQLRQGLHARKMFSYCRRSSDTQLGQVLWRRSGQRRMYSVAATRAENSVVNPTLPNCELHAPGRSNKKTEKEASKICFLHTHVTVIF